MAIATGTRFDRYEVLSLLGRGGMGEVYLALDTRLKRKVALKLLPAAFTQDADRVHRFEQEAQAASALNHPNIITIYEIGEADGTHFIATEFIDGETLRQRIASDTITLHEALDIAAQVASALAGAHSAGIVHRDIKPENIMLRPDSLVKVLDFGLAKLTESSSPPIDTDVPTAAAVNTETGAVLGTPRYMSPEQARGLKADSRTDVFSLGVVLYEMIARRSPFEGSTAGEVTAAILRQEPPPLQRYTREAPDALEWIVTKALAKDRERRYQAVKDLALDLKGLSHRLELEAERERSGQPGPKERAASGETVGAETAHTGADRPAGRTSSFKILIGEVRRHKLGMSLILAAVVVAAVAAFFYFSRTLALTEKDTILLADFVNTTGDADFDGTLKQALAVQLQQTPFLNLFPEEGVRETLTFMGRSTKERLTREIGRDICQRHGLKAMLIGTIASLGNYVITLEAINGKTGEVIASEQTQADGKKQVLQALGQAANGLRRKLGESLSTLQKYNAPIEQATTSSLEALNAYSKGLEQIYSGNFSAALPLFNRAVEIDPNFAAAYNWLSWTYINLGDTRRTAEFAEKAYALRDRVTEIERLHTADIYYLWATGEWDKQKEVDELIEQLYPNDWVAHNSLSINYTAFGPLKQAVAEATEAIRLNPNEVHTYWHLARALTRLNRFDEAKAAIQQAQARKIDAIFFRSLLYEIAFAQNDTDAMRQQLDLMLEKDGERVALGWQAGTAAFAGRWREAQTLYRRIAGLGQRTVTGRAAPLSLPATIREALVGFCEPAGEAIAQALTTSRVTTPGALVVPILPNGSLCGEGEAAQELANELERRYPTATRTTGFSLPVIRAAIALQRNQPEQAKEFLSAALPAGLLDTGMGFWLPYLRGQTYLRLGNGTEATVEFRRMLDHRGWDPVSSFYPMAHLGLARASALAGDVAGSRKAYQDFFALWKDADADLPILIGAKQDYEKRK